MQDPELTIDWAIQDYLQLGYSENWINQRLKSIEIRKELTDEWDKRGLKEGTQSVTLTYIITKAWSDKTTKEYKMLKVSRKKICLTIRPTLSLFSIYLTQEGIEEFEFFRIGFRILLPHKFSGLCIGQFRKKCLE